MNKRKQAELLLGRLDLVEAGFLTLIMKGAPPDTPQPLVSMLRSSFFYGAKHMLETMLLAQELDDDDLLAIADKVQTEFGSFILSHCRMASNSRN